jgi:hypothetical protein
VVIIRQKHRFPNSEVVVILALFVLSGSVSLAAFGIYERVLTGIFELCVADRL